MRFLTAVIFAFITLVTGPALAAEQTIIVLDASGSMWGQIGGKTKMSIARETLHEVLKSVPAGNQLGLMVYGHREKGSCSDIELAVPPAAGTADRIAAFVDGINPKGKTPISQAVKEAAEALKYTEEKATVILVTDGLETCEADPCALASELERQGVDFTAHVVGFGLTPEEGKQVACLAENTGGKYFEASDAPQLVAALTATVMEAPRQPIEEPVQEAVVVPEFNVEADSVLSEGGPSIGRDNGDVHWLVYKADADNKPAGDYLTNEYHGSYSAQMEPGKYVAEVTLGGNIKQFIPFEVKPGEVAKPFVNFDAGYMTVLPKRTAQDDKADDGARVDVSFNDVSTTFYGPAKFYASAGTVKVGGSLGAATAEETFTIKAGETLEKDLIIGSGVVVNKAIYADGGPEVDSSEIFFEVVSVTKDINGERKRFGSTYGTGTKLDTPTGDLVLMARLGSASSETPFTIKAGERKDVTVNINAGVLAVTAADANRIILLSSKKDIQGKQNEISATYGVEHKDTVPPGDYIIRVTYDGDIAPKEKPVTIKAGERSEVTVE